MSLAFRRATAGAGSPFSRLAASILIAAALALPARAYDLQYRQNGTSFSASELRTIFNNGLPAAPRRCCCGHVQRDRRLPRFALGIRGTAFTPNEVFLTICVSPMFLVRPLDVRNYILACFVN